MLRENFKKIIYFLLNLISAISRILVLMPRVAILMYHSVGDNKVLFTVSAKDFARQMDYLARRNYRVISLGRLAEKISRKEKLNDKTVVLTFDDGYADNFINVWPLLKKYNFPATIFLPTVYIGKAISNSQNTPIKVLNENQIREMANSGLVNFGSHTHSHPRLENISNEEFISELRVSKEIIERITGQKCNLFSYPKGFFREEFAEILKNNGFQAAVTVKEGLIRGKDNLFLLKRNFIYSAGGFSQFKGKLNYSVSIFNQIKR